MLSNSDPGGDVTYERQVAMNTRDVFPDLEIPPTPGADLNGNYRPRRATFVPSIPSKNDRLMFEFREKFSRHRESNPGPLAQKADMLTATPLAKAECPAPSKYVAYSGDRRRRRHLPTRNLRHTISAYSKTWFESRTSRPPPLGRIRSSPLASPYGARWRVATMGQNVAQTER